MSLERKVGVGVTVEAVGYASFWRVNVTMRNREPGCVIIRNRKPTTITFLY